MIEFRHVDWRKEALAAPGSWWRSNEEVWATCLNGHAAHLGDHEIAIDGVVMPSVDCPEDGCGFHDFVRLVDWESGEV